MSPDRYEWETLCEQGTQGILAVAVGVNSEQIVAHHFVPSGLATVVRASCS